MSSDRGLLDRIRSRGEEVLSQLSAELLANPRLAKAVEGAQRGREKLERAAAGALRQMNVSTQGELARANARIATLERELAELRRQVRARRSASAEASPRAAAKPAQRRRSRSKPGAPAE